MRVARTAGQGARLGVAALVGLLVAAGGAEGAPQRLRSAIAWASLACCASFLLALNP